LNSWKMPQKQNGAGLRETWFANNHTVEMLSTCHIRRKSGPIQHDVC